MKTLSWIIDFYFLYFLYNERKLHRYHDYMTNKWGEKYIKTHHMDDRS